MRTLDIMTVASCPLRCKPCPQDVVKTNYDGRPGLSLEDFKVALNNVPKDVRIVFSGFVEPFLNPCALDMMEYASKQGYDLELFSTLVGLRLQDVPRLTKYNIKFLCVHEPDHLGNTDFPETVEFAQVSDKVKRVMRVHRHYVMDEGFISNQRAGNCADVLPSHVHGPFYCAKLWSPQFVMYPDCSVVLCCMDMGRRHMLGNLLEQKYDEIAISKEYRRIARSSLHWDGNTLCRGCRWASFPLKYAIRVSVERLYRRVYHLNL